MADWVLTAVTQAVIGGLLQQRQPEILESDDSDQVARFEARVSGAAVEVLVLTGLNPVPGPLRDLAVEAIACETASGIEYAEWPEQQAQGDQGRGYYLHQRYLELLARLREYALAGAFGPDGALGLLGQPRPRGRFPKALPFPDPARGNPCS